MNRFDDAINKALPPMYLYDSHDNAMKATLNSESGENDLDTLLDSVVEDATVPALFNVTLFATDVVTGETE